MSAPLGRVLVVDDTPSIRALITVNLELEGFEVIQAVDGVDALAQVHAQTPDVVTMDVVMPRMDGLEAAGRLRADEMTSQIPIILVTAAAQEVDRRKGDAIGVDAYLTKPFEPAELIRLVRELTGCR